MTTDNRINVNRNYVLLGPGKEIGNSVLICNRVNAMTVTLRIAV
jgi:hypothetical protein